MSNARFVVVGASLAGLRAVEAARRSGHGGSITLIGAERHLPYDRPPLSKAFLNDGVDTVFRDESYLRDELDVDLRLGEPATGLDTATREVLTEHGRYPYDAMVIATGARARPLPGCRVLRELDDAHALREALDTAQRIVVIGAGFIGSEIASSARERGIDVTVVEALPTPLARALGEVMGAACARLHIRNGTSLRCGVAATVVEDGTVRLDDGTVLAADVVVSGIGAVPATDWLTSSGLHIDDGVVCDRYLHTGAPGVYAAGDIARWYNPTFDRPMRVEHWTNAAEQGATAARNALDPPNARPFATVPYFWSDWYGSRIQFLGIPAADEVRMVDGGPDDEAFVALYRKGDRLAGTLSLNRPQEIMKYRRLIADGTTWADALAFAETRRNVVSSEKTVASASVSGAKHRRSLEESGL